MLTLMLMMVVGQADLFPVESYLRNSRSLPRTAYLERGQIGFAAGDIAVVPGLASWSAVGEAYKYIEAKDEIGFQEMVEHRRIIAIRTDTKVKVLDRFSFGGRIALIAYEVRVMAGDYKDAKIWLFSWHINERTAADAKQWIAWQREKDAKEEEDRANLEIKRLQAEAIEHYQIVLYNRDYYKKMYRGGNDYAYNRWINAQKHLEICDVCKRYYHPKRVASQAQRSETLIKIETDDDIAERKKAEARDKAKKKGK